MGTSGELLSAIEARLQQVATTQDPTPVLEQSALNEARELTALLGGDGDLYPRFLLGMLYWHRSQGLPQGQGNEDRVAAITMLTPCFLADAGAFPSSLRLALAEAAAPEAAAAFQRALAGGDSGALSESVGIWERIRDAIPVGHRFYAASQAMAGTALQTRFGLSGAQTDLDAAIQAHESALDTIPAGNPSRAMFACNLGAALRTRYGLTGSSADMDTAVALLEDAVRSARAHDPSRVACQTNLGIMLCDRFKRDGRPADIDAAVEVCGSAVKATLPGDPDLASRLGNLGLALRTRFEAAGSQADLHSAIDACRAALDALPGGHPHRAPILTEFGSELRDRFGLSGDLDDLDAAINAQRAAADAMPTRQPGRAVVLSNLGAALQARFERSGMLADLDAGIAASREAADSAAVLFPERASMLSNLGIGLRMRYERSGELKDLDDAVTAGQAASDVVPADHPGRGSLLSNLANTLLVRYRHGGLAADLDRAVNVAQTAAAIIPADHPDRAACLSNLASALGDRFENENTPEDLDGAVDAAQGAADESPSEHPVRVNYLINLGGALRARSQRGSCPADANKALSAFTEAAAIASAAPAKRIEAARAAAALIAATDPGQASDLLEMAITLLPLVTPRYLDRADQQYAISGFADLASDAAALALADPRDARGGPRAAARALRLLEAGRALLISQALDTRTELTELRQGHPQLAQRFAELRDQLNAPADSRQTADGVSPTVPAEERRRLAGLMEQTLNDIRALDDFAGFALPPTSSELRAEAAEGPIITLNVSQYRCDALLLTENAITCAELPGLTRETVIEQITAFHQALNTALDLPVRPAEEQTAQTTIQDVLGWLWDNVAGPALSPLDHDSEPSGDATLPRVWWAPGGLLSLLPVHAAGRSPEDLSSAPGPTSVLDRVVSSYTPTVRALRYARRRADLQQTPGGALIVGMASTPGLRGGNLPNVTEEVDQVRTLLSDAVILSEPETRDASSADDDSAGLPTRANVLTHLPGCSIAHFACHSASHPSDPSKSLLYLHDHAINPLTVASLMHIQHDHLQLVYLSACETALSSAAGFYDEAIHLTSAFQLAGARHVIGTLWEIRDEIAARIAISVYKELRKESGTLQLDASARALHRAIRKERDDNPAKPALWAPYVHAGC
jgi:hypothetical protein